MEMLEVEIANSGAVADFLKKDGQDQKQQQPHVKVVKKISRKKRKKAGSASLEQIARAVTDPYAEMAVGTGSIEQAGGVKKKRKKGGRPLEQAQRPAVNDPYLF